MFMWMTLEGSMMPNKMNRPRVKLRRGVKKRLGLIWQSLDY